MTRTYRTGTALAASLSLLLPHAGAFAQAQGASGQAGATGPLLAPFFLRDDFEKENVIATKAACQFWLHLLKIPAFLTLGFNYLEHAPLLVCLIVAVIVGTYGGKRILESVPPRWFVIAFQVVLSTIAIYLIVSGGLAWRDR